MAQPERINFLLSEKEKQLIIAFRKQPQFQYPTMVLLGIEKLRDKQKPILIK